MAEDEEEGESPVVSRRNRRVTACGYSHLGTTHVINVSERIRDGREVAVTCFRV